MAEEQTTVGQVTSSSKIGTAEYFIASPFFAGFDELESIEYGKFLDIYSTLPPYVKIYFSSPETAEVIYSLGTKFNLSDTEISATASMIRGVIIGNIFIKEFPSLLSTKLNIDEQKSKEIANDIVSKSFGTILSDIQRIQRAKFPERIAQMKDGVQPPQVYRPQTPPPPPQRPSNRPLEEELEKVASIIDLRNKPRE